MLYTLSGDDMSYSWILLCTILVIVEFVTVNLVTIWFAIGAFFAFLTSLLIDNTIIQIVIFFLVSILSLIFTRPVFKKYLVPKTIKTNYDKVVGMIGIVTKDINLLEYGEVKVDGKYWTAKAEEEIKKGSKVEILSIEGVKLIVKRKENDL